MNIINKTMKEKLLWYRFSHIPVALAHLASPHWLRLKDNSPKRIQIQTETISMNDSFKIIEVDSIADKTVNWIEPNDNSCSTRSRIISTSLFNFLLSFFDSYSRNRRGSTVFRNVYCLIPTRKTFLHSQMVSNDTNWNFVTFNIKWINVVTIRPSSGILFVFSSFYRMNIVLCIFLFI